MDSRHHQRGTAIITALLVVMLAATVASVMLAQQSEALTRLARATERSQLSLHANTTLEWARSALLAQQKNSTYVALTQPWAQGLVARPIESAIATGVLADAQAKWNINNVVDGDGRAREADVAVLVRLLRKLEVDTSLAYAMVDWIDRDDDPINAGGVESAWYWSQPTPWRAANRPLVDIEELRRVRGVNDEVMKRLRPYVTALPTLNGERTRINFNTAPMEVLMALFPDTAQDVFTEAMRLRELPYSDLANIKERVPRLNPTLVDQYLGTTSLYFEATLAITGQYSQVRNQAMLALQNPRSGTGELKWPDILWIKEN